MSYHKKVLLNDFYLVLNKKCIEIDNFNELLQLKVSNATILVIFIIGFTAGPAVSLYGSPTVSPVTADLCASEPFPPKFPSSIYFFALSQAPPPAVIETATNSPVIITPNNIAPNDERAASIPPI